MYPAHATHEDIENRFYYPLVVPHYRVLGFTGDRQPDGTYSNVRYQVQVYQAGPPRNLEIREMTVEEWKRAIGWS